MKNDLIHTARAGEIEMDYAVFGRGKDTLVILPGMSLKPVTPSAKMLSESMAFMLEKYTVYLFDRRRPMTPGCVIRDMAEDTFLVMRSLGIEKADIYGASQGGMMAMCLAIDHPEFVNRMVLASTASRGNPTADTMISSWAELARPDKKTELAEKMIDSIYSPKLLEKYRRVFLMMSAGASEAELLSLKTAAEACAGFDVYGELDRIKCPVLVIGSEGDKVLTPEASREIAEKLGCECCIYGSEYSHAVYDEAPDFLDRMFRFLNS